MSLLLVVSSKKLANQSFPANKSETREFLYFCRSVRYIPFPGRHDLLLYARLAGKPVVMAPTTYEGVVSVDATGRVRQWETGVSNLVRSLEKWKGLIGEDYHGPLQVCSWRFSVAIWNLRWLETKLFKSKIDFFCEDRKILVLLYQQGRSLRPCWYHWGPFNIKVIIIWQPKLS